MTDAVPMTFTDNPLNPLEETLYEGLADHTKMGVFERLMLEADLYAVPEEGAPGGTHGDDGAKVLRPGEQLVLRGVVLNDGRNTVTLFTDPRRATPAWMRLSRKNPVPQPSSSARSYGRSRIASSGTIASNLPRA